MVLPEERRVLYRVAGGLALRLERERDGLERSGALLLLLLSLLLLEVYVERIGSRK